MSWMMLMDCITGEHGIIILCWDDLSVMIPIGQDGELNLYAYAENNTVMFVDPFGLSDA